VLCKGRALLSLCKLEIGRGVLRKLLCSCNGLIAVDGSAVLPLAFRHDVDELRGEAGVGGSGLGQWGVVWGFV
jgi:hypothetical protein